MPAPFRKFLVHLKETVSLRQFTKEISESSNNNDNEDKAKLIAAYNSCIENLVDFRNKNI
jgi:hypothetical protein